MEGDIDFGFDVSDEDKLRKAWKLIQEVLSEMDKEKEALDRFYTDYTFTEFHPTSTINEFYPISTIITF
jgi:hypothetical protein